MFRHTSKRRLLWALGERFLPSALRVTTIVSQRLINALSEHPRNLAVFFELVPNYGFAERTTVMDLRSPQFTQVALIKSHHFAYRISELSRFDVTT